MRTKAALLKTSASLALVLGMAGPAFAGVYAGSALDVSDLTITFLDSNGDPITNLDPRFTFNVEDSATLNGATDANGDACSSTAGNCNAAPPRLTVPAANAPGSTITRADTDYSLLGPTGTENYANSNSEITTAQLLGDAATRTQQVAENELSESGQAQASTNIQSNTTFSLDFSLHGDNSSLLLDFNANPEMEALVDLLAGFSEGLAQANMTANFTLTRDGAAVVSWSPNGVSGDVLCDAGLTCAETDPESLNETFGVGPGNSSDSHSLGTAASAFGLDIFGLDAGDYRLSVAALTSVNANLTQAQQVPEPGSLLLLGAGFLGLGFMARRRRYGSKLAA